MRNGIFICLGLLALAVLPIDADPNDTTGILQPIASDEGAMKNSYVYVKNTGLYLFPLSQEFVAVDIFNATSSGPKCSIKQSAMSANLLTYLSYCSYDTTFAPLVQASSIAVSVIKCTIGSEIGCLKGVRVADIYVAEGNIRNMRLTNAVNLTTFFIAHENIILRYKVDLDTNSITHKQFPTNRPKILSVVAYTEEFVTFAWASQMKVSVSTARLIGDSAHESCTTTTPIDWISEPLVAAVLTLQEGGRGVLLVREFLEFEGYLYVFNMSTCAPIQAPENPMVPLSADKYYAAPPLIPQIAPFECQHLATLLTWDPASNTSTEPREYLPTDCFLWTRNYYTWFATSLELNKSVVAFPLKTYFNTVTATALFAVTHNELVMRVPGGTDRAYLRPSPAGTGMCGYFDDLFCSQFGTRYVCPPRFYKSYRDYSPCMPCPAQTYASNSTAVSCTPAPPGYYAPVGSAHPILMSDLVNQAKYLSEYPFPINTALKSPQNMILRSLFLDPRSSNWPYFASVMSASGIMVLVLLFGWLSTRKQEKSQSQSCCIRWGARLAKFVRAMDAFEQVDLHTKRQKFIVYKTMFGGVVTIMSFVLSVLAIAFLITLTFAYEPLLIGHADNGFSLNGERSSTWGSVGDYVGEHKVLLSNLRRAIDLQFIITLNDCVLPRSTSRYFKLEIQNCNEAGGAPCSVDALKWTSRGTTCVATYNVPTPHAIAKTMKLKMSLVTTLIGFTSFKITIASLRCGDTWQYEEGENCPIIRSNYSQNVWLANTGTVLSGLYPFAVRSTYVIRKSEGLWGSTVQSYVSLSSQQTSVGPSIPADAWLSNVYKPDPLEISIMFDENSMWIYEQEKRILQYVDAFAVGVVIIISFYSVARIITQIEKKIIKQCCPVEPPNAERPATLTILTNGASDTESPGSAGSGESTHYNTLLSDHDLSINYGSDD